MICNALAQLDETTAHCNRTCETLVVLHISDTGISDMCAYGIDCNYNNTYYDVWYVGLYFIRSDIL